MHAAARLSIAVSIASGCVALSCAKKQPTSRPVVVEDVLPFGTDVCFPKGMKNTSPEVGGALDYRYAPTTTPIEPAPLVPEVIHAPTTRPAVSAGEELNFENWPRSSATRPE